MNFPASTTSDNNAGDVEVNLSPAELAHADLSATSTDRQQDGTVYTVAAATLLPQWLRILSPSPWSMVLNNRRKPAISCQMQQLRLAASWAAAKLTEVGIFDADTETFSELSRSTLIHWQLGLLENGKPQRMEDRRSEAVFPAAWYVVRTLEDTAVTMSPLLLDDLSKHLSWLMTRSSASSWSQATAVGAAASGGVLLRNTSLVTLAKKRLSNLIARQSSEGWFPEGSRFDLIKQAQVIGVLGQLLHAFGWTELEDPLRRAVGFFASITANQTVGQSVGPPMAGAFLFPQGFELLAAQMPEASRVANGCRRLAVTMARPTNGMLSDELAALAGGNMLAAASAKPIEHANHDGPPAAANHVTTYREAGLVTVQRAHYTAVLATRLSGAWHAHWRTYNQSIFDPPIAVVLATGRLCAAHMEHAVTAPSDQSRFEIEGSFGASREAKARSQSMKHKLRRDGFRRVVTCLDEEIRVLDEVWFVIPCQAILLQFANTDSLANSLGSAHLLSKTPLIIDGGRRVVVERVYQFGKLTQIHRLETSSFDRSG